MLVSLENIDIVEKELEYLYSNTIMPHIDALSKKGIVCKPIFCYVSNVKFKRKKRLINEFFRYSSPFRLRDSLFDYTKIVSKRNQNGCIYSLMIKYYPSSMSMSEIKKKHLCKEFMHSILKITKSGDGYRIKYDARRVKIVEKYLTKLLSKLENRVPESICKENFADLCRYMFIPRYTHNLTFYGVPVKIFTLAVVLMFLCLFYFLIRILFYLFL